MSVDLQIISADDHVLEPPNLWVDRLAKKFREAGPRVERLPKGTSRVDQMGRTVDTPAVEGPPVDFWHFEDTYWALTPQFAGAGLAAHDADELPLTYDDIRPGCFKAKERLADMDLNRVDASLCFPNYSRFAGQRFAAAKDLDLGLACVRADNDWMVDEWCAGSNSRLIPLCIVPLWDADLAAAEVYRNATRGVHAVCFTELPTELGLPSLHRGYWDPFFAACDETESVISMHVGSGARSFNTGPDMPEHALAALTFANSAASMAEYLSSGLLGRFKNIKLFYAECQVGWIPYLLERLDDSWQTAPYKHKGRDEAELPSTFYYGRVYSCMFKDRVGTRLLDLIGEDQVMFESDYPHLESTWPNTTNRVNDLLGDLSSELQYKVARGTAIKLFRLSFDSSPELGLPPPDGRHEAGER